MHAHMRMRSLDKFRLDWQKIRQCLYCLLPRSCRVNTSSINESRDVQLLQVLYLDCTTFDILFSFLADEGRRDAVSLLSFFVLLLYPVQFCSISSPWSTVLYLWCTPMVSSRTSIQCCTIPGTVLVQYCTHRWPDSRYSRCRYSTVQYHVHVDVFFVEMPMPQNEFLGGFLVMLAAEQNETTSTSTCTIGSWKTTSTLIENHNNLLSSIPCSVKIDAVSCSAVFAVVPEKQYLLAESHKYLCMAIIITCCIILVTDILSKLWPMKRISILLLIW